MKKLLLKWGLRVARKAAEAGSNSHRKCDIWKEPLSLTTATISEEISWFFSITLLGKVFRTLTC